jgi:hypothetical protein
MIKSVVTCDHCGKDVPNTYSDHFHAVFMYASKKPNVDACCEEHLGCAVAKAFGIPIDGDWAHTVEALTAKLAAVEANLESVTIRANKSYEELEAKRTMVDGLADRCSWLEAENKTLRTPPPNVDGKTPADVAREAFATVVQNHHESEGVSGWDAAAHAVLSAFAPNPTQAVREALESVRERIEKGWLVLNAIDAELSALPIADLTGPKKPTKPLTDRVHELGSCSFCEKKAPLAIATSCTICGCPNERAFLDPCTANGKHSFEAP